MIAPIELYLNLGAPQGGLVTNLDNATEVRLGPFYQGQIISLRVFPVVPSGRKLPPNLFAKVPIDDLSFELVIGPRAGDTAILAAQYSWSKQLTPGTDGKSGYFYGDLNLNTEQMNAAIGDEESLSTFIEFRVGVGANPIAPVYQSRIEILASVKDPTAAPSIPTPEASYLTAQQCYDLFVMWNNALRPENAGRRPIFVSPNGAHTREIGVDDNGIPVDNLT